MQRRARHDVYGLNTNTHGSQRLIDPWDGPLTPPDGALQNNHQIAVGHPAQEPPAPVAPTPVATIRAVHNRMQAEVSGLNDLIEETKDVLDAAR